MHRVPRRHSVAALLIGLIAAGTLPLRAAGPPAPVVTIAFDFDGRYSNQSVDEMKREVAGILHDTGLQTDWRRIQEAQQSEFDKLVVVRFKGTCILEPVPVLYDERGPLAFTYTTESGGTLPFSEVACDKVTATMRTAMWGSDYGSADRLLGRALGRVVAHELVHMLTNSGQHGREGVAGPALSGRQLITARLPLSDDDVKRLRAASAP